MINRSISQSRDTAIGAAIPALSAAAVLATLALCAALATAKPAAAYDDDVEVVCFEYEVNGSSVTECQTIEELTAECEKTDPEFTSDVCQGLIENRVPAGLELTTEKKRRDTNVDIDRDRGKDKGGRDSNSGGNGGGGNSGGGSNGGGRDSSSNNRN